MTPLASCGCTTATTPPRPMSTLTGVTLIAGSNQGFSIPWWLWVLLIILIVKW